MTADDLAKILDELGQRLGPAGSHVFELAVRQQIILGSFGVIGGLAILIGTAIGVVAFVRHSGRDGSEWFIAAVGGFVGLFTLACGALGLLNPEYSAIQELLKAVKA